MDVGDPGIPLAELFRLHPETAEVFVGRGMLCFGCPIAPFHDIADACREYHLDEPAFRALLAGVIATAGRRQRR